MRKHYVFPLKANVGSLCNSRVQTHSHKPLTIIWTLTPWKHFISSASDEIQSLFSLQANTSSQLQQVIQYFGEDPKRINSSEFFAVFAEFITKFEASIYRIDIILYYHDIITWQWPNSEELFSSNRKRICTISPTRGKSTKMDHRQAKRYSTSPKIPRGAVNPDIRLCKSLLSSEMTWIDYEMHVVHLIFDMLLCKIPAPRSVC